MKTFLLILAAWLSSSSVEWLGDFQQAKQIAREGNKMILLNFSGSDWCAPCIKMKKDVFDKAEFEEYSSKHLVLVRADFPRQKKNQLAAGQKEHNERLAEQYNPNGKFPLTLLLDAEGKVIAEWDGFQGMTAGEFVDQISLRMHGK
jgi:thioredoxin-related protein